MRVTNRGQRPRISKWREPDGTASSTSQSYLAVPLRGQWDSTPLTPANVAPLLYRVSPHLCVTQIGLIRRGRIERPSRVPETEVAELCTSGEGDIGLSTITQDRPLPYLRVGWERRSEQLTPRGSRGTRESNPLTLFQSITEVAACFTSHPRPRRRLERLTCGLQTEVAGLCTSG